MMFQTLIWLMIWYEFDQGLVYKNGHKIDPTGNVLSDLTCFGICTEYKKSCV